MIDLSASREIRPSGYRAAGTPDVRVRVAHPTDRPSGGGRRSGRGGAAAATGVTGAVSGRVAPPGRRRIPWGTERLPRSLRTMPLAFPRPLHAPAATGLALKRRTGQGVAPDSKGLADTPVSASPGTGPDRPERPRPQTPDGLKGAGRVGGCSPPSFRTGMEGPPHLASHPELSPIGLNGLVLKRRTG
ncbi:hypothetical protein GCM10023335_64490 [Streptomyces siamensis]|uniref:Uncharacterized protein n=1 Tax=Streptomyces siamensis TaxID=1274986 RepID=A0ABP9JCF9_9ACTN